MAATAGAGAAATAPAGYKIVHGAATTAPSSALDTGTDTLCPSGTVAWGGGVGFRGSGGPGETIGTSDPAGSAGWNALVNNSSGASQSFSVDAVCAKKPKGYKIVTASAANPAGAQTTVSATCPAKTVVFSAGIASTSDAATVRMTSLWPASSTKVTGRMFNGSGSSATVQVEAVCGVKPAKYTIVKHAIPLAAATGLEDGEGCPVGTSVLGGGTNVGSPGKAVAISESSDSGKTTWYLVVDNTTPASVTVTDYAICAA
jgi:hypothetical protein